MNWLTPEELACYRDLISLRASIAAARSLFAGTDAECLFTAMLIWTTHLKEAFEMRDADRWVAAGCPERNPDRMVAPPS